jgi:mRNA-degrading endonuclease toxin of MazEF toxin-antitoxin module
MKPWEIWTCLPPGWQAPHPAVIVSSRSRVANKPELNIIMCSTQRAARPAEAHEVILDSADGLNWPTLCKCDLIYAIEKTRLTDRRGEVTPARRRAIVETMRRANEWL